VLVGSGTVQHRIQWSNTGGSGTPADWAVCDCIGDSAATSSAAARTGPKPTQHSVLATAAGTTARSTHPGGTHRLPV
jgi:hypothetical protein